ncbi:MAG: cysteine peptidase family C39 domain-containing protein [Methanobacterium sp.]|jgi:predicted double-glycine peptidase
MQSTDFSCGPAALATVLQNMGINSTEEELKVLAGTDTSGTSMYGLVRAAQL